MLNKNHSSTSIPLDQRLDKNENRNKCVHFSNILLHFMNKLGAKSMNHKWDFRPWSNEVRNSRGVNDLTRAISGTILPLSQYQNFFLPQNINNISMKTSNSSLHILYFLYKSNTTFRSSTTVPNRSTDEPSLPWYFPYFQRYRDFLVVFQIWFSSWACILK